MRHNKHKQPFYVRTRIFQSLINMTHWIKRAYCYNFNNNNSNSHGNSKKNKSKDDMIGEIKLNKEWLTKIIFDLISMISFYVENGYLTNFDFKLYSSYLK